MVRAFVVRGDGAEGACSRPVAEGAADELCCVAPLGWRPLYLQSLIALPQVLQWGVMRCADSVVGTRVMRHVSAVATNPAIVVSFFIMSFVFNY